MCFNTKRAVDMDFEGYFHKDQYEGYFTTDQQIFQGYFHKNQ